jgi:hypothetical protein
MEISNNKATEFQEIIDDAVEYFCDHETISGELAWTLIECLATAKIAEINGELAAV